MAEEKYFVDESGLNRYHENYKNTILNSKESIVANTNNSNVAGANGVKEIANSIDTQLTASDGLMFQFMKDASSGKYGFPNADGSFHPFELSGIVIAKKWYSPVGLVNDSYTIPDDGYLYVGAHNCNSISRCEIKLNGTTTSDYGDDSSGEGNYTSTRFLEGRYVTKGTKLTLRSDNVSSGSHRFRYFAVLIRA